MKVVFFSDIDSPHWIKFSNYFSKLVNFKFYYLEDSVGDRGKFWRISRGSNVIHLENTLLTGNSAFLKKRYYVPGGFFLLIRDNPDVIVVSGFSKFISIQAYIYSILFSKKFYVFTERSRNDKGELRGKSFIWTLLRCFYFKLTGVIVTAEDTINQFLTLGFKIENLFLCYYPTDIDKLLLSNRTGITFNSDTELNVIFPNRMTPIYNPLFAISLIQKSLSLNLNCIFHFNKSGELFDDFSEQIKLLRLENIVKFVDVDSWDDLHEYYLNMDVMILPARFSNGNFTILESMAAGLGIIISNNVMGLGNEIVDSVNGFKCDLLENDFFEKLLNYYNDRELILKHAAVNNRLVFKYSAKSVSKMLFDIIS